MTCNCPDCPIHPLDDSPVTVLLARMEQELAVAAVAAVESLAVIEKLQADNEALRSRLAN